MFEFKKGDKVGLHCQYAAVPCSSDGLWEHSTRREWLLMPTDEGVIERTSVQPDVWLVRIKRSTWTRPRYFHLPLAALKPRDSVRACELADYAHANNLRGDTPAPRLIERTPEGFKLTPGWYCVLGVRMDDMKRTPALHVHEFATRQQADDLASLRAEADPNWHYIVFQTKTRVSPYEPPQLPKTQTFRG